ncbi:hypothetical protein NDU88_005676 [Pleurodeles waltl]|uniref:Uncharacterized protein n=1 Tax=Pleurodeles waltl TaxID=8319 RepID=A0AAV7TVH0_PLEWA|nr:hypothetical protein NDU88_005676 [Pleurodeles waltl]
MMSSTEPGMICGALMLPVSEISVPESDPECLWGAACPGSFVLGRLCREPQFGTGTCRQSTEERGGKASSAVPQQVMLLITAQSAVFPSRSSSWVPRTGPGIQWAFILHSVVVTLLGTLVLHTQLAPTDDLNNAGFVALREDIPTSPTVHEGECSNL